MRADGGRLLRHSCAIGPVFPSFPNVGNGLAEPWAVLGSNQRPPACRADSPLPADVGPLRFTTAETGCRGRFQGSIDRPTACRCGTLVRHGCAMRAPQHPQPNTQEAA